MAACWSENRFQPFVQIGSINRYNVRFHKLKHTLSHKFTISQHFERFYCDFGRNEINVHVWKHMLHMFAAKIPFCSFSGMNAAVRAVVRMGLYVGAKVYFIHEVSRDRHPGLFTAY